MKGFILKAVCILACLAGSVTIQADEIILQKSYCPVVGSLTKNSEGGWAAPGGWKTNTASMVNVLSSFIGAQWIGIGVGQVICVYAKEGRGAFPVALKLGILVPAPEIGIWGVDKGGYRDCASTNVQDCPFFYQVPVKPDSVYEELDFYKGKPVND